MLPIQIVVRDMPASKLLEENILERANRLLSKYKRIMHFQVMINQSQKHKSQGKEFHIHIDVTVPNKEINVTKESENFGRTLSDAFHALSRQLRDYSQIRRHHVKTHHSIRSDANQLL